MKKEIHPKYYEKANISCACGNNFTTGSTLEKIKVDLCSLCHPFYTGKQKLVDTARRVEKFQARVEAKKKVSKTRKGKKVIISFIIIGLQLYFWGAVVSGINYGESSSEVQELIKMFEGKLTPQDIQDIDNLNAAIDDKDVKSVKEAIDKSMDRIDWFLVIVLIPAIFLLPLLEPVYFSTLVWLVDDLMRGFFLHFGTVYFVEGLELLGLLVYIRLKVKPVETSKT